MIRSEAIILLEKFLKGESSKKELSKLHQWINSPDHVEVLSGWMAQNWEKVSCETSCDMDSQAVLDDILNAIQEEREIKQDKNHSLSKNRISIIPFWLRGVAAVLLPFIFLCVGYLSHGLWNKQVDGALMQTIVPRGQKAQIVMADGTKVWLNSESVISYPSAFGSENREVTLSGEAYFEVTKDKNHPFYVKTKGMNIKVLGTTFNVCNYEDEELYETTLVSGSVQAEFVDSDGLNAKIVTLKPNQKITCEKSSSQLNLYSVDSEGVTAWREGKLVFRSENFERLARKLERWYDVKIHFMDDDLKSYRYTGTFDRETVEQAVNALRLTSPFKYTMDKRDIYIYNINQKEKN